MTEKVEPRGRRAPFLWASSSAFRVLIQDLPARQRAGIGWVYTCLAASASDSLDGDHQGFAATSDQVRALTGMSRPTFRKAIQTLEQLGLLEREVRTDDANRTIGLRYNLLEPGQEGANGLTPRGIATRQNAYPLEARARNRSKKEEKTEAEASSGAAEIADIHKHWQRVMNRPRSSLTPERKAKIAARRKKYSVTELKTCIDRAAQDPFTMGDNDRGRPFNDLTTIFKNDTKVADFLEVTVNGSAGGNGNGNGHGDYDEFERRMLAIANARD